MCENAHIAGDTESSSGLTFFVATVVVAAVFFLSGHNLRQLHVHELTFEDDVAQRADTVAAGSAKRPLAYLMLATLGFVFLLRRHGRRVQAFDSMALMILLCLAWCATSVLWSTGPNLTTKRAGVLALTFVGTLGLCRQLSARQLAAMALCIAVTYVSLGLGAEIAFGKFRPWADGYRFAGTVYTTHQAPFCACLTLAAVCFANHSSRHWKLLYALAFAGAVMLMLTRSRASSAGLMAGLIALWAVQASARQKVSSGVLAVWATSALLFCALVFGWEQQLTGLVTLGRTEGVTTLTGRIPLWTELLPYVENRPFLGYGYEAFWSPDRITRVAEAVRWPAQTAHSVYIEGLLSVGLIGSALILLVVLNGLWRVSAGYRDRRDPGLAFILTLLSFGLVQSLFASQLWRPGFVSFVVFCGLVHLAFFRISDKPTSGSVFERSAKQGVPC